MTSPNFHQTVALRSFLRKIIFVESNKYEKLLKNSVGLGLTTTVSYHAQRLCHIHREEIEIEGFLLLLTQNPNFEFYSQVFNRFGFGQRIQGMLLSQIYSLRYLSRRRFEKALGIAPTYVLYLKLGLVWLK